MTTSDIIIVGGGLSGLTCCNYLASAGYKVYLLEKSSSLGGRGRTNCKEGYYFNLGARALYNNGAAFNVLQELEIPWSGRRPTVNGFLVENDQLYSLPTSLASILKNKYLSWSEKWEFIRVMNKMMSCNIEQLPNTSIANWLSSEASSLKVEKVFQTFFRLASYSKNLEALNCRRVIQQMRYAGQGVYYLDHGWQTLVDGLHHRATRNNATILHEKLTSIEKVDNQWQVTTPSQSIKTEKIIFAIAPQEVAKFFPNDSQIASWKNTSKLYTACLDVALSELPNPKNLFALGINPTVYYSVHSTYAKLAPKGALVHLVQYLDQETHHQETRNTLEGFLEKMQPGWKNYLVTEQFLPRICVANQSGLCNSPKISENLYVIGDWVGEGMLLDAALGSARLAAQTIIKEK